MISMIAFGLWLFAMVAGLALLNAGLWRIQARYFGGEDRPNTLAFTFARLSILLTFNAWILTSLLYWEGRSVRMSNEMAPIHWLMSWEQGASLIAASVVLSLLSPFVVLAALGCGMLAIFWGRRGKESRSVWLGGIGVALNSLLIVGGCGLCLFQWTPRSFYQSPRKETVNEPYRYHGEFPRWNREEEVREFAEPYEKRGYHKIVTERWQSGETVSEPLIVFASNAQVNEDIDADLVLVAQGARIDGKINGNVEFFGQSLRISKEAEISGDLFVHGAQSIRNEGVIEGKLEGNYNNLHSTTPVQRD